MYILNLLGNCGNPALANLFNIAQRFITVIQIIAPILAIISLGINLTKSVMHPEDKKNFSMYKNWLIALVMVFAIPTLVNATMGMLGEDYSISSCWNNASNASTRGESTYKPVNNKKPSGGINTNPDSYDKGSTGNTNKNNNSNNSSNTNNNSNTNSNSGVSNSYVIMLGDSRCVQMKSHVGAGSEIWSCKGSMGLSWMKSTGVPNVESKIGKGTKVVIMMGVNDLYQPEAYITYINSKANEWANKGAKTYFVSVNPVDGTYSNLTSKIVSFNSKLKSNLNSNVRYIDTYNYLVSSGFSTSDGLHYKSETSRKIYNYVKSNI